MLDFVKYMNRFRQRLKFGFLEVPHYLCNVIGQPPPAARRQGTFKNNDHEKNNNQSVGIGIRHMLPFMLARGYAVNS